MPNLKFPKISFKRPSVGGIIFWVVAIGLGMGTLIFARSFVACWSITNLPGLPPASCDVASNDGGFAINPQGTPVAVPTATEALPAPEVQAPQWDGGSRINILFVGLRGGDPAKEDCPLCTDTLIVVTLDPATKTAGMLSIPRDMWVNIPGFGYSRINTAWTDGVGSKLPGGGPGLTMQTVSQFIGVPIDYYAQVDFNTFVDMIDTIGGVDVNVTERMVLDPLGSGKDKVVITPGFRHLNGIKALAYARCREASQGCTDGDVGRAQRQQQVIFAIMDKVFSPDYFPIFIKQAPSLYSRMSAGIHTNLSLEDGIRLAYLVSQINRQNIKNGVIDNNMALFVNTTLAGQPASVLKPKPDQIRVLRDEIFSSSGPTSPLAAGADPLSLVKQENARIRVINSTFAGDFGQRTATYLQGLGLNVTELGNAGGLDHTVITLYSPKLYTMRFLLYIFKLNGASGTSQIKIDPNPASTVDVEIRLGTDALNANVVP